MKSVDFKVFRQAADLTGGRVAALRVPADLTRKEMDDYAQFVATYGAKGLAYLKVNPEGLQSPIVKFLPENVLKEIVARTGAQAGDFIFFAADKARIVNDSLGALRVRLGQDKGLVEKDRSSRGLNSSHLHISSNVFCLKKKNIECCRDSSGSLHA